jgi:RNA polymerase sigma-70 factor (ECF subfamily)
MKVDPKEEIVSHLPSMRAFAVSLTQNNAAADDLVQDAIVKAWTNFDKFQPGTNLRAWLFTILRNTFFSYLRKRRYEVEDIDAAAASALAIEPAHDGRLDLEDLVKALRYLTLEQRETIVLVGALGFGYEEAADLCGVPVGTIKSRANRAREQLSKMMSEGLPGQGVAVKPDVKLGDRRRAGSD